MTDDVFATFGSRMRAFSGAMKTSFEDFAKQFNGKEMTMIMGRVALLEAKNKGILKTINDELATGPLAGYIYFNAVIPYPHPSGRTGYQFKHQSLSVNYRTINRLKAYAGYLQRLTDKYDQALQYMKDK